MKLCLCCGVDLCNWNEAIRSETHLVDTTLSLSLSLKKKKKPTLRIKGFYSRIKLGDSLRKIEIVALENEALYTI